MNTLLIILLTASFTYWIIALLMINDEVIIATSLLMIIVLVSGFMWTSDVEAHPYPTLPPKTPCIAYTEHLTTYPVPTPRVGSEGHLERLTF